MNEGNIPGKKEALISLILGIVGLVVALIRQRYFRHDSWYRRALLCPRAPRAWAITTACGRPALCSLSCR